MLLRNSGAVQEKMLVNRYTSIDNQIIIANKSFLSLGYRFSNEVELILMPLTPYCLFL